MSCFVSAIPLDRLPASVSYSKCSRRVHPHRAYNQTRCKVEAEARPSPVVVPEQSAALRQGPKRPRKAPELHVANDRIESTLPETLLVAGFGLLTFLTAAKVVYLVSQDLPTAAEACAAAVVGYLFADFSSGVYHFLVDNYGNERTPVFGYQIAAFQGHHKSPWTITNRDFANNLFRLTIPTSPQMLALLLLPVPPVLAAGLSSALFWIVASQELHKQAHMQRPSRYARILQSLGLAISSKGHGLHHASPFDGHYCMVSGVFNHVLDKTLFFRRLEVGIYKWNGVEPISWGLSPELKHQALSLSRGERMEKM
jgi:palmitoyl-[glycerolipid] 3-(E)-desaturase